MSSMVRLNHVTASDFVTAYEKQGLTPAIADYAVKTDDAIRISLCALLHWKTFAQLTEISVSPNFRWLETIRAEFEERLKESHSIRALQFLWRDEDSEPWAPWSKSYEGNGRISDDDLGTRGRLRVFAMPVATYQCMGLLLSLLSEEMPSEAIKDLECRANRAVVKPLPWTDMPDAATAALLLLTLFERELLPADIGNCEFYTGTQTHISDGYQNYRLMRIRIALASDKTLLVYFDSARDSNRKGQPFLVKRLK